MSSVSGAAGHAALAICESMLLSLTENKIIDGAEARAILTDAAAAHRNSDTAGDRRRDRGPRGSRLADRHDPQGGQLGAACLNP